MVSLQIVFMVTVFISISSGLAATCIVIFGDTRRNAGQRSEAEKMVQIAAIGAAAIASLLVIT